MPPTTSLPRPSDRWIPWYFVAFFIALVSILVPMCVIAVRTNSGVVTDNAYEKGLAYNKAIQAAARQNALHWRGDLAIIPVSGDRIRADFSLADANGKSLDNAAVTLWLVRPAQAGKDQTAPMKLQSAGRYSAELALPLRGLWEARVSATANGQNYQIVKRITMP
jgi:nitrogen fixation protein FixH